MPEVKGKAPKFEKLQAALNRAGIKGAVQTIVVSKEIAGSLAEARAILKSVDPDARTEVDEKSTSYRFRQRNPEDFQGTDGLKQKFWTYKKNKIPSLREGVAVVLGAPK